MEPTMRIDSNLDAAGNFRGVVNNYEDGRITYEDMAQARVAANGKMFYDKLYAQRYLDNTRADSTLAAQDADILAYELEQQFNIVIQEQFDPTRFVGAFPVDSSLAPGAREYTVERETEFGEMVHFDGFSKRRGGNEVARTREVYKIHPFVTSIRWTLFDQQAHDFVGRSLKSKLEGVAGRTAMRFLNNANLNGIPNLGIPGLLTQPYTPRAVTRIAISTATNAETIRQELAYQTNTIAEKNNEMDMPNTIAMSVNLANELGERRLPDISSVQMVYETWLDKSQYFSQQSVWRDNALKLAGPNGEDVMAFYRANDPMSMAMVMPQSLTMLPMQNPEGLNFEIPFYLTYGGLRSLLPMTTALLYVQRS